MVVAQARAGGHAGEAQRQLAQRDRVGGDGAAVGADRRLGQIDAALERLEKRIWVGVYGVAAFLLSQMAETIITAATK